MDDGLAAMNMAHGCPVYAPKQGTDEGEALFNATRSGATSAACGDRWMEARRAAKLAQKDSIVQNNLGKVVPARIKITDAMVEAADLKHANDLLFSRYDSFIRRAGIDEGDPRKTSLRNLAWMCRTAIHEPMSTDKASRWLGFVQGCLAMRGIIDVDDERDYSRSLFHEAVGEQPTLENTDG